MPARRSRAPIFWWGAALAALLVIATFQRWSPRRPPAGEDTGRAPVAASSPTVGTEPEHPASPPESSPDPVAGDGARVAIVIDDLGWDATLVDRLQALAVPLSYAVLPGASETEATLQALRGADAEVLCHLPMAGPGGAAVGARELARDLGAAELTARTELALAAVPGAVGASNHMGSELSSDPEAMRLVLQVVAGRGLFYFDSRTSASSVGYRIARELGMAAAERQVFLDDVPEPEAVRRQFATLLAEARRRGAAIAVGHPRAETIRVLEHEIPRAVAAGYLFVPVSYLLDRTDVPAE